MSLTSTFTKQDFAISLPAYVSAVLDRSSCAAMEAENPCTAVCGHAKAPPGESTRRGCKSLRGPLGDFLGQSLVILLTLRLFGQRARPVNFHSLRNIDLLPAGLAPNSDAQELRLTARSLGRLCPNDLDTLGRIGITAPPDGLRNADLINKQGDELSPLL